MSDVQELFINGKTSTLRDAIVPAEIKNLNLSNKVITSKNQNFSELQKITAKSNIDCSNFISGTFDITFSEYSDVGIRSKGAITWDELSKLSDTPSLSNVIFSLIPEEQSLFRFCNIFIDESCIDISNRTITFYCSNREITDTLHMNIVIFY